MEQVANQDPIVAQALKNAGLVETTESSELANANTTANTATTQTDTGNTNTENSESTTTTATTQSTATKNDPPAFDEGEYIKSKFGYSSPEEVVEHLSQYESLKKEQENYIKPTDGNVKRLNDFLSKGGTMEEFMSTQVADYTKLDDFNVQVAKEKAENPHMSVDDIQFLLRHKYKIDEDGNFEDNDEGRLGKIQLQKDANASRKDLISAQQASSIPDAERKRQAEDAKIEKTVQDWHKTAEETVKGFDKLLLPTIKDEKTGQYENFTYEVTEKDRQTVLSIMKNPLDIFSLFETEQELRDALTLAVVGKQISKALSANKAAEAVSKTLDSFENPSGSKQQLEGNSNKPQKTFTDVAREAAFNY